MTLAPALQATGESDAADAAPRRGSTYYHLYDQLGSTRLLTDASQTVTDTYHYYAFGEIRSSSGSTANPFKFVGCLGYYDDPTTDLQYLRARYYAPDRARFVVCDPASLRPDYIYCAQHPTSLVDPGGDLSQYAPAPPPQPGCTWLYSSGRRKAIVGRMNVWTPWTYIETCCLGIGYVIGVDDCFEIWERTHWAWTQGLWEWTHHWWCPTGWHGCWRKHLTTKTTGKEWFKMWHGRESMWMRAPHIPPMIGWGAPGLKCGYDSGHSGGPAHGGQPWP